MRRILIALALTLNAASAMAQSAAGGPAAQGIPNTVMTMPFQRQADRLILPASGTAKTYRITQPAGSFAYRGINPCRGYDVAIKTVAPLAAITTTPSGYPGVDLVTSATENVTATTGTLWMSRYGETLASSPAPTEGFRLVSIMTLPVPGATVSYDPAFVCTFNLQYGKSS